MRKNLLEIVCCPVDKAPVALVGAELDEQGDIVSGKLVCSHCKFAYPIESGIPNLLPPEFHS